MFSMFCLFVFVFAWPTWVYYYANKELLLLYTNNNKTRNEITLSICCEVQQSLVTARPIPFLQIRSSGLTRCFPIGAAINRTKVWETTMAPQDNRTTNIRWKLIKMTTTKYRKTTNVPNILDIGLAYVWKLNSTFSITSIICWQSVLLVEG